jgi:hypothetical protein
MISNPEHKQRILLLLTEQSPMQRLWQVVEQQLSDAHGEVVALFVTDERWRRAASLPFTREISRVSGAHQEFTAQRAAEIDQHIIGRIQSHLRELATNIDLQPMFEVLAEHEVRQIENYVSVEQDLLVASADVMHWPVYRELTQLRCRILFVESGEQKHAHDNPRERTGHRA